jgi:hypothetical protein
MSHPARKVSDARPYPSSQVRMWFRTGAGPGASLTELYVIAYTANGCDLVTVDSRDAETQGLSVIDDPWLKGQEQSPFVSPRWDTPWGPYRCPGCRDHRLQLWPRGHWD